MMSEISVVEVSPRDGLQNEAAQLGTKDKLELIRRVIEAGARRVEVTSFAHPKLVPQMADAEAVCAGLPRRNDVVFTGLVLNQRGFQRWLATERLDEVGVVVPLTDSFCRRNQGMGLDDCVAMARGVLSDARRHGKRAQVTLAVAFGCPFEGEVPWSRVLSVARTMADENPVEIALADTIGVGVPSQVLDGFGTLHAALGPAMPLRAHFHDTRNTGIANAYAAMQAGVTTLDASLGGIGGCPFSPGASGNVASEDLVYMLDRMQVEHGLNFEQLLEAAKWLQGKLDRTLPSKLLKAGGLPSERSAECQAH